MLQRSKRLGTQIFRFVYPPQGPFFPGYNGRGEDRTIFADPQKPFVCLTPQAEPDGSTSCEAVIEVKKVSDGQVELDVTPATSSIPSGNYSRLFRWLGGMSSTRNNATTQIDIESPLSGGKTIRPEFTVLVSEKDAPTKRYDAITFSERTVPVVREAPRQP